MKVQTKKIRVKAPKSRDEQLTEYLKIAEDALVSAIELFSGQSGPQRRVGYYSRLIRAQEAITGLYREELVRIRGPLKIKKRK